MSPSATALVLPGGFQDRVEIAGLEEPTAVRFAGDGHVFVAAKTGTITVYDDLSDPSPEIFADLRTEVYDTGDRGLLAIEVDPDFPTRPYIYALYTYDHMLGEEGEAPKWGTPNTSGDPCPLPEGSNVDACPVSGRLVRLTAEGSHAAPSAADPTEDVLVEDWCQQYSSHSIGDLRFGPEGALYASGGDGANFLGTDYGQSGWPETNICGDPPGGRGVALTPPTAEGGALRAQDLRTPLDPTGLNGSIIRVDPDTGQGFEGNPMQQSLDANARRVIAYGFRNPFRFAIEPESGDLYAVNVGWSSYETLNRVPSPPNSILNFGWPCYEGPEPNYIYEELELDLCEGLYAEPGAVNAPLFFYRHDTSVVPEDGCHFDRGAALSGLTFYEGGSFPDRYDGALFFSDSVRGCIYAMLRDDEGVLQPGTVEPFLTEGGLYPGVDVEIGPGGDLYYLSLFGPEYSAGALHRIEYAPGAPLARLDANPRWGDVPLEVHFDAAGSEDPQGESLNYGWDLDGDGSFETAGGAQRIETYADGTQNRTVGLRVTDGEALSSVAQVTVYPGDMPPAPEIEEPLPSHLWSVGETIHLSGRAPDDEGVLGGSRLYWRTRMFHCPFSGCHAHPLQVFPGSGEADLIAPDHDLPAHLEISLTATDARGLSATEAISIDPRTVDLEIASGPSGLTLGAGLKNAVAPFQLPAIEGSNVVLSAPQTQVLGGATYTWGTWSDGGARIHTVKAKSSTTYTATYGGPPPTGGGAGGPGSAPPPPGSQPPSAPTTALRRHPPKRTHSDTAHFAFSADERTVLFLCKLDSRPFRRCGSPWTYRHLRAGRHLFRVVAIGAGGRDPSPARFSWTVLKR